MEKQTNYDEQLFNSDPSAFTDAEREAEAAYKNASDAESAGILSDTDLLARAEKEELSVEEAFAALEQIVRQMEDEGISLEDSFNCYETGIRLVRYCSERIDRVEKKVQMLRGEGEAPLTEE